MTPNSKTSIKDRNREKRKVKAPLLSIMEGVLMLEMVSGTSEILEGVFSDREHEVGEEVESYR